MALVNYEEDFFFSHVKKLPNGCWEWTGAQRNGYGAFGEELAHVWSYKHFKGPIPVGKQVGHECHDKDKTCLGGTGDPHRLCVNPEDLGAQTPQENNLAGRGNQYKGIKVCKYNHSFTEENTYWFGPNNKWRGCKTCRSARAQGKDPAAYVRHGVGSNQYGSR